MNEVIEIAADLIERPDLVITRISVRERAQRALYAVHGKEQFHRDLATENIVLVANESSVISPLPARFRRLEKIEILDATGGVLYSTFKERTGESLTNYYGFETENTYQTLGGNISIKYLQATGATTARLYYYRYPTFVWDAGTSTITSDSWILTTFHHPVVSKLASFFSDMVDKTEDTEKYEGRFGQDMVELLANNLTTIGA